MLFYNSSELNTDFITCMGSENEKTLLPLRGNCTADYYANYPIGEKRRLLEKVAHRRV